MAWICSQKAIEAKGFPEAYQYALWDFVGSSRFKPPVTVVRAITIGPHKVPPPELASDFFESRFPMAPQGRLEGWRLYEA